MKIFIDDIRNPPDDTWTLVRTVTEAIRTINRFRYDIKVISFDHDISYPVEVNGLSRPYPSPETFQAVAYYVKQIWSDIPEDAPKIVIHSANPIGAKEIHDILPGFDRTITPYKPANRLENETGN